MIDAPLRPELTSAVCPQALAACSGRGDARWFSSHKVDSLNPRDLDVLGVVV